MPQQRQRNRRQPQQLHAGLRRAQLVAFQQHDLAGAGRQRDRAAGALAERTGQVADDRAEIDRDRAARQSRAAPNRRSGSSSADHAPEGWPPATAQPPAGAPDQPQPHAEYRAPHPPPPAPPTAATAGEAPLRAPPARPHSCTADRPDTPTQPSAPPAAAAPSCSYPTTRSNPAPPDPPRSQRSPRTTSTNPEIPTPRQPACAVGCSPWKASAARVSPPWAPDLPQSSCRHPHTACPRRSPTR